jgi:hypothetical protein
MTRRTPIALLLACALAAGAAGCGDEVADAQRQVDEVQRQVDRATDAVQDPAGAVEREADRVLDDALTPDGN